MKRDIEEFTIKIHESLFPAELSNTTETISVGIQVQNDDGDSQVKGNNVSLEDTLSKGIPEMTKDDQDKVPDCDNVLDTTAAGSSRSGSPEDPTEQVIENKSEGHPEAQSDQIGVQGTRKVEIPDENASEKFDELQHTNVLNGIGICESTVAESSNPGIEEPVERADKGHFEEHFLSSGIRFLVIWNRCEKVTDLSMQCTVHCRI